MLNFRFHRRGSCALLSLLLLAAVPAFGQVPQDVTYTGRLVDDSGSPLAGPVDLELRVFDAETAGTELYSEQHLGVALDATGGFSVQLGAGTSPSATFGAELFANVNRWLEVVVGAEVLTPRQIIASVPWALVAQQANAVVPGGGTVVVDCDAGDVLQEAIHAAGPRTTIQVEGTCTENIVVSAWKERVIIDGQGSATLTAASGAVVTILGRDIVIRGFNGSGSINGGGRGIVVSKTASATIENNIIFGAASQGIGVEQNSFATITGNVVRNNDGNGIRISGSSARIGTDCAPENANTIRDNLQSGIALNENAEASIRGNLILNNTTSGIFVIDGSMADTASNDISGNVGNGVFVRRGSSVRMGRESGAGCDEAPNTTAGNDNGLFGINCKSLSTVEGRLGGLSGGDGGADLSDTSAECPNCCFADVADLAP